MMSGAHSSTVIVPRSGMVTLRARTSAEVAGPAVASVLRVLASCWRASSIVGGG